MQKTVAKKQKKIAQLYVNTLKHEESQETNMISMKSGTRKQSKKNIVKPLQQKSQIGAFISDNFNCNGCHIEQKTELGVFFCQKCDFHKCQICIKKECHSKQQHHSVVPKCNENHTLRFINSHAHKKLFASDKNKTKPIYFKNGSYQCDIQNLDDCYSCSKLKLENLICKKFSCPRSHQLKIHQNAAEGATCDFCFVNLEDQVIGSCKKCRFQACENCLSYLDKMNLTLIQRDFIMANIDNHIAKVRDQKKKFINSENQIMHEFDLDHQDVTEILNKFQESLDENFENLNFNENQEIQIIEKIKNMLGKKPFKEAHFCQKNHELNIENDKKSTCCLCKNKQKCYSCNECGDFKLCIECAFQIENIQIQDFQKPFFMKIFGNIMKKSNKTSINLKETENINLNQTEVQKVVNQFIFYLNQQINKIKQKQDQLKSYLFYQRDTEDLICKKDHRMIKTPIDRDKKCSFCHLERKKFTIFHSCRFCKLDICEKCVNVISSFQLNEEQQPYVIQLFHQTIIGAFENKSRTYCCQIKEEELEDIDISKKQLENILIGMQSCFQGYERFRCPENHQMNRANFQKVSNIRCDICKMFKKFDSQKDRYLECSQCNFNVCNNKCLSMLEILQIQEDKKPTLMKKFSQILKNEYTFSCDYIKIQDNDKDCYFIEKMKLFLEVQNNIEDDQPQFCKNNHQLLKRKVDQKPLQCIICKQDIIQNKQKNVFCLQCDQCDDFLICNTGCKLQIDQLNIQDDLKHIFMDIFQNLLPIIKTAYGKKKSSKGDEAGTKNNLIDKDDQQLKQQKIKKNLNADYLKIKNEIVEQNKSSLQTIQYDLILNQMEHYITDFKCLKTGHVFLQQKNKPLNHKTKCESCNLVIDNIQEKSKGYQKCAECQIPNCNTCYKNQLVKLCNDNHTFAGKGDKCLHCQIKIQNSKYHQCVKCGYFKCFKCKNNKHKYATKYFIQEKKDQNTPDEDDKTQNYFQKGFNILQDSFFERVNQEMVDKKKFQCSNCGTKKFEVDDHCYECEDCNIRTCFKCANIEEEVIGMPQQIEYKYSDTGTPKGAISDTDFITVDLTFVTIHVIYVLFLVLQSSCITSYIGFYEIYMNNQCNKSMYVMPEIVQDYLDYPIPKEYVFYLCTALAVFLKIASVEYLRLMLLSYLKLEKNQTFFVVTLFCVTAPSCLMAPFYTYDHDKCHQKNFMMDMNFSSVVQVICVIITAAVMALGLFYIFSCLVLGFLDNYQIHQENTDHLYIINKLPFASLVLDLLEKTNKSSNPYVRFFIGKIAAHFKIYLVRQEIQKMKKLQDKIEREINKKKRKLMEEININNIKLNIECRIEFDEIYDGKCEEDFQNFLMKRKERKELLSSENFDDQDEENQNKCKKFCTIIVNSCPTKEQIRIYFSDFFGYDNTLKGWKKVNNLVKIILKQILIYSSICFALCMLVIQLCTYQLFQGQLLATGGNNEFLSLLKLFTYFLVFSQKDQLAFIERLKQNLIRQANRHLVKELQYLMKMLNSNICKNIIRPQLQKVVGEDLKFDSIFKTLNPILEEAEKQRKQQFTEDEKRAKQIKEAKLQAEKESIQKLKNEVLKKKQLTWRTLFQKLTKKDESLNIKIKGILPKIQSKNKVQQLSLKENKVMNEGGEPELRPSICLSQVLNQIDQDDSDDEDLKKYCCFKTKKSRKNYKQCCQFFKNIFSCFQKKDNEVKPMGDSELESIKQEFMKKQKEIENEFKAELIQMIKKFITDVKDQLPDNARIFIKRFMNEVIFNKYTPQKFNLKLTNIVQVTNNYDPIEKAQSYFMEQFYQGNIVFVNKFIRSSKIQELFQKYAQQIVVGQLQNRGQLLDLVSSFMKVIEAQKKKFEKFISEQEIQDVDDWIQEVQYQVNFKGANGFIEESEKLRDLFLAKINDKGYEFIELYQEVVQKYMNDLISKLQNFSKFKIQNFLIKKDENEVNLDHDPSQDSLIKQQVKEFKKFLEQSPITDIIKDLITSGGIELAKELIILFINQDNFALNLLNSISDNKDLILKAADSIEQEIEISQQNDLPQLQSKQENEKKIQQIITNNLRQSSIVEARKNIEKKLKNEKRNGKLIFKNEYIVDFLDKLKSLQDIQNLEYTLKYELQKIIINQALSPKTIESKFDNDPECIKIQQNQIQEFYKLYLKRLSSNQFNQLIENKLRKQDITDLLQKNKEKLEQMEINTLLNKLQQFFMNIKQEQIYFDFESKLKYKVYQYQSRVIQQENKKSSQLMIVKSITLKKISDNIWIESKDYNDDIINQMYDIILSKKQKEEQIEKEKKTGKQNAQSGENVIQTDEHGPPDGIQQDDSNLNKPSFQKENAQSSVFNVLNTYLIGIFTQKKVESKQNKELSQEIDDKQNSKNISEDNDNVIDDKPSEVTTLINKNQQLDEELKKDEDSPEQVSLINKNEDPSDQIPREQNGNIQQKKRSKQSDDIFNSIENKKIKEYIDKMEIEQLIEYMEQILKELKIEEVSGFLIAYFKETGVSFFKQFISVQLHKFTNGNFKQDGVIDLLKDQQKLFQDYGNDFQDIINNHEKIENSCLHCLEKYVVNPLYNWFSKKIPQILQFLKEQVWPRIVSLCKRKCTRKNRNRNQDKVSLSQQKQIRGQIEENEGAIQEQNQDRLSVAQHEVNQGIAINRGDISDQENTLYPMV